VRSRQPRGIGDFAPGRDTGCVSLRSRVWSTLHDPYPPICAIGWRINALLMVTLIWAICTGHDRGRRARQQIAGGGRTHADNR
jgi:hypothetical protein